MYIATMNIASTTKATDMAVKRSSNQPWLRWKTSVSRAPTMRAISMGLLPLLSRAPKMK
jgi:hypothetical protein